MTPRQALEDCFTTPSQYTRLTAFVRRRGIREDPEDVVQQAICDALAVEAVPSASEEVPRWFQTIVSRRVVDRFRRQRREYAASVSEIPCHVDPEGRDLLRRIERELSDDARRNTLAWLLREHAGESLKDLARELSIDAAALRQRICRLRRELRHKYLVASSLVLLLLVGAAWYWQWPLVRDALSIDTYPAAVSTWDGDYVLVDASRPEFKALRLQVALEHGRVTIQDERGVVLARLSAELHNDATLTIHSGLSRWHVTVQHLDAARVQLSGKRGFVTLERRSATHRGSD